MIFYLNASKKTSKKQYLKTGEDRQKTENAGQFRPKKSGSAWTVSDPEGNGTKKRKKWTPRTQ